MLGQWEHAELTRDISLGVKSRDLNPCESIFPWCAQPASVSACSGCRGQSQTSSEVQLVKFNSAPTSANGSEASQIQSIFWQGFNLNFRD